MNIIFIGIDSKIVAELFAKMTSREDFVFHFASVCKIQHRKITNIVGENRAHYVGPHKSTKREVNFEYLAKLEALGEPSVRSIISGDRVLRKRSPLEALSYLTELAANLEKLYSKLKPTLVITGFDQAHCMMSFIIARYIGVPWVAMSFSVIPENLMGYCRALYPDSLIPEVSRPIDDGVRSVAIDTLSSLRGENLAVFVFRPPYSFFERLIELRRNFRNILYRMFAGGYNKFVYPTAWERVYDILRRYLNTLTTVNLNLIKIPTDRPYAFLGLQMKPEMSTDTQAPFYKDQVALIKQISEAIPISYDFVIKLHLSDPDNYSRSTLKSIMSMPNVFVAHPKSNSQDWIKSASLVCGVTGTTLLEASLFGKPTLVFGKSPYVHFPSAEKALAPDLLGFQIQRLLAMKAPEDEDIISAFERYICRYHVARINNWDLPVTQSDIDNFSSSLAQLIEYVSDSKVASGWYEKGSADVEMGIHAI